MLSKAIFNFDTDFYLGENLEGIVLEGVNALSIQSEGNVSIGKVLVDPLFLLKTLLMFLTVRFLMAMMFITVMIHSKV